MIYVCENHNDSDCIDINNQYVSLFFDNIKDIYNIDEASVEDTAVVSIR